MSITRLFYYYHIFAILKMNFLSMVKRQSRIVLFFIFREGEGGGGGRNNFFKRWGCELKINLWILIHCYTLQFIPVDVYRFDV